MTRRSYWLGGLFLVGVTSVCLLLCMASAYSAPPRRPGHRPKPHIPGVPPAKVLAPAPLKALGPPPSGKIWTHFHGKWIAVSPPPGPSPYIWNGMEWVTDPTPPPQGAEWVPGHWTDDGWVIGHWAEVPVPASESIWVSGHWKGNIWIPGHWKGVLPKHKTWVPGHWGSKGRWIHGHWK
jgi:hypothetical protein